MESKGLRYFRAAMYILAIALGLITIFNPTGIGFFATYALIAIALLAALGFAIFTFVKNPRSAIKTVAGLVLIAALFFIGQSLTEAQPVYNNIGEKLADADLAQYAGASVFTGGVMLAITFIAFILSEVIGIFR